MKPLRWTVVATHVPPGGSLGGIVRYTIELIRALADRDDVEVSALTTRAAADTLVELVGDTHRVATVPDAPTPLLSLVERNVPLTALRSPDVVHGIKHLVPRRGKALRVLTVHDMLLLDRPEDFGRGKRLLLPRPYRASIRDADLLLCVSDATRQRMAVHVPGTERHAVVVHPGTSESLRANPARPIEALAGKRFALVVGDSSPRKNLPTIMYAWLSVRARLPDAVLALAGPPSWGATAVGKVYDSLVATGAVLPLGHIDDAGLRWAYENAGVALFPSLAEGFGSPAAEALTFGAPLLISSDPALVEAAAGRALGIVEPMDVSAWADAIVAALSEPKPRGPVASGRSYAEVADETVAAVHGALARRRAVQRG